MVISLLAAIASISAPAVGASPDCSALLAAPSAMSQASRQVAALDLATLRDFGRQEASLGGEPPFSISPDGRRAALLLRRGDPTSDTYCMGAVVVPFQGGGSPTLIEVGGDPILNVSDLSGLPYLTIRDLEPVTPQCSPDRRAPA